MNCPQCSGAIVPTYWVCPHCKADLKKPENAEAVRVMEAVPPSRKKLLWEMARILIATSLLMFIAIGVFAYSISQVPVTPSSAPDRWRTYTGYSLVALATAQLACAILLMATKRDLFAWIPVLLTAGLAIAWLIGFLVYLDSEGQARRAVKLLIIPIAYGGLLLYKAKRLQKARD